ncbi:hypothetical protein DL96DRAFT_1606889 [Flagelloscypha sp. PMI_526]|nr:hypothetical protein DL96DRAFT_1606889 [Flagelloscypha sp. PMI_526]
MKSLTSEPEPTGLFSKLMSHFAEAKQEEPSRPSGWNGDGRGRRRVESMGEQRHREAATPVYARPGPRNEVPPQGRRPAPLLPPNAFARQGNGDRSDPPLTASVDLGKDTLEPAVLQKPQDEKDSSFDTALPEPLIVVQPPPSAHHTIPSSTLLLSRGVVPSLISLSDPTCHATDAPQGQDAMLPPVPDELLSPVPSLRAGIEDIIEVDESRRSPELRVEPCDVPLPSSPAVDPWDIPLPSSPVNPEVISLPSSPEQTSNTPLPDSLHDNVHTPALQDSPESLIETTALPGSPAVLAWSIPLPDSPEILAWTIALPGSPEVLAWTIPLPESPEMLAREIPLPESPEVLAWEISLPASPELDADNISLPASPVHEAYDAPVPASPIVEACYIPLLDAWTIPLPPSPLLETLDIAKLPLLARDSNPVTTFDSKAHLSPETPLLDIEACSIPLPASPEIITRHVDSHESRKGDEDLLDTSSLHLAIPWLIPLPESPEVSRLDLRLPVVEEDSSHAGAGEVSGEDPPLAELDEPDDWPIQLGLAFLVSCFLKAQQKERRHRHPTELESTPKPAPSSLPLSSKQPSPILHFSKPFTSPFASSETLKTSVLFSNHPHSHPIHTGRRVTPPPPPPGKLVVSFSGSSRDTGSSLTTAITDGSYLFSAAPRYGMGTSVLTTPATALDVTVPEALASPFTSHGEKPRHSSDYPLSSGELSTMLKMENDKLRKETEMLKREMEALREKMRGLERVGGRSAARVAMGYQ